MPAQRDANKYYVYVYFRPDKTPCYVGKGKGSRCVSHINNASNPYLRDIIERNGGKAHYIKLFQNMSNAEALAMEISLIAAIGRQIDGGPLVNLTDGGEGCSRVKISDEGKEALRRSRLGKKASEITKQRQRERALANGSRPPSRKGVVSEKRGVPVPREQREKIAASLKAFHEAKRTPVTSNPHEVIAGAKSTLCG